MWPGQSDRVLWKAGAMAGATAGAVAALVALALWALWTELAPGEQTLLRQLWAGHAGLPILAGTALLVVVAAAIIWIYRQYISRLPALAEETRVIALSNAKHRIAADKAPEVNAVIDSINLLADRYQALREDVQSRIAEAKAALEEERNTLAALMSKLTQGVLVCNPEGRILLYNRTAQKMLEGPVRQSGGGDWIGLGRSIFGLLDESLISHARAHIQRRLGEGEDRLLVPFVAARPGGQLLNVHLVPILDHDQSLRGYLLTLEDITRRYGIESRRDILLKELLQGHRSGLAGIRAAIETILAYPDMEQDLRRQFEEIIRDESVKMAVQIDRLEQEHAQELTVHWPSEELLASDLLAAIEGSLRETRGISLEVDAPVDPVWVKADRYALVQCFTFLVDQIIPACRAEQLALNIEMKNGLVTMILDWSGVPLHTEALKSWGMRAVSSDWRGASLTLFDVIERHGGSVWAHRSSTSGRPCVRVVLPAIEQEAATPAASKDGAFGQDFDFQLFDSASIDTSIDAIALRKLSYTVIDTETTGLAPRDGDEIIAIAAVRIVNGRILRREVFDTFVNPRIQVSEASRSVHGISQDMLRGQPRIEDVLPLLRRFIEDTVIVGHNVAFDMRFLQVQGAKAGINFTNPILDTLLLECVVHPNQEDKRLEAIAERLGIAITARHTALGDALTTAEVFLALLPLLEQRGITTLGEAKVASETTPYARLTY